MPSPGQTKSGRTNCAGLRRVSRTRLRIDSLTLRRRRRWVGNGITWIVTRCIPAGIVIREGLMKGADFRRLALSMPEAAEGSHFGNADFRVGGKIFATLSLEKEGFGVLL